MTKKRVEDEDAKSYETDLAGKYLSFGLGEELYGCPISPIEDIIEMKDVTQVPQTRDYVEGVVNLRGTVIPVMNLRRKLGLERVEATRRTCIIVVELDGLRTGLIVDRVEEVTEISDGQVDPAPGMGQAVNQNFVAGMGKLEDEVLILLDLENILKQEEIEELREVQSQTAN